MIMKAMQVMFIAFVVGLFSTGYGLYLLFFTPRVNDGNLNDIFLAVGLLTIGVFLLVPAKVYIIIRLTQGGRKK